MPQPLLTRRALPERLPPWGIGVFESHHAPDFQMEWRRHPFLKLVYVLAGAGTLRLDKHAEEFGKSDLLVVPVGQRNRIVDRVGQPASLYVLCLSRRLLAFDPGIETRLRPGRQQRDERLALQAASCFRRLLYEQSRRDPNTGIAMAATSLELLQRLLASTPDEPVGDATAVARHVAWLDSHFYEATTIDAAAESVGLSRRAFTKAFRELTGETWLTYVHTCAVDHAAKLLTETDAPIASVAFECGFGDLSTFYRRFKSQRGCAPGEWRAREA